MSAQRVIAGDELRFAMACFATGVVVITADGSEGPVGMAVAPSRWRTSRGTNELDGLGSAPKSCLMAMNLTG